MIDLPPERGVLRWVSWDETWHLRFDDTGPTAVCGADPGGLATRVRPLHAEPPEAIHVECVDRVKAGVLE